MRAGRQPGGQAAGRAGERVSGWGRRADWQAGGQADGWADELTGPITASMLESEIMLPRPARAVDAEQPELRHVYMSFLPQRSVGSAFTTSTASGTAPETVSTVIQSPGPQATGHCYFPVINQIPQVS